MRAFLFCGLFSLGFACTPTSEERRKYAGDLAAQAGFKKRVFNSSIPIITYNRFSGSDDVLHIYTEGDGHAYESRYRPPSDPTPVNPLSLELALNNKQGSTSYIARPGQYLDTKTLSDFDQKYWTTDRFSAEAVNVINLIIDELKEAAHASNLNLTGYSGGGVIAALVSAKRKDVLQLTTIAAPLDLDAWIKHHGVSDLSEDTENPTQLSEQLCEVPQTHHVGGKDKTVPPAIIKSYMKHLNSCPSVKIITHPNLSHNWH